MNFFKSKEDTPLYIAAEEGHWKIVSWLLAYGRIVSLDHEEVEEFLQHYSTKMINDNKLEEKVSTYHMQYVHNYNIQYASVIPNVCLTDHIFIVPLRLTLVSNGTLLRKVNGSSSFAKGKISKLKQSELWNHLSIVGRDCTKTKSPQQ